MLYGKTDQLTFDYNTNITVKYSFVGKKSDSDWLRTTWLFIIEMKV